jgi:cytochrome c oxidase cbb3-type subunit 3
MRFHAFLRIAPIVLPVALLASAVAKASAGPAVPPAGAAQGQPPPAGRGAAQGRGGVAGQGRGPNFPQQQRPSADATVLARGKGLYDANCSACHGVDLRGGQQGGPNLLRAQTLLLDKAGELIIPIVRGGRPNPTPPMPVMPAFPFPDEDIKAIAEYLHSVAGLAGRQGRPPIDENVPPERVLVGDAAAGQTYFASRCASCHSVTGDLQHIASRAADPRELQNMWVSGGGGGGRGGRGGGSPARPATVIVTPSSGPPVQGRLARIDEFTVSLIQDDGTRRTFARDGMVPKVEIRDPADAHRKLVPALDDRDMHNVTAYLWTLK